MNFILPQNVSEQISDDIAEKIISLKLKPGQRILESKLAEEMGVSRGPIRDSLRRLERNWLVELFPRREARVTELTEDYINDIFNVLNDLYVSFVRE